MDAAKPGSSIRIIGVAGLPEITTGVDLAALTVSALTYQGGALAAGDVVVFTSKIVSKAEGRLVALASLSPSPLATTWATAHRKDPRHVEAVLREARRIVRMDRGVLIAETHHGFVCANAGVDASNTGNDGHVVLLPQDPDGSARRLRDTLSVLTGIPAVRLAVVISDTFGRPWRCGQTNVAIGAAGIAAVRSYAGRHDPGGYALRATEIAVADELAGAAELVMHKLARVPVALIRGYEFPTIPPGADDPGASALVREPAADFFR